MRMENQKLTVLFIDDDSLFTDIVGHKLQEEGMTCLYAPMGQIGLDMLEKRTPVDVILLDLAMPQMDGFEVLRRIKTSHETKHIAVIVFSNDATDENRKRAIELGAAQFIEKVTAAPSDVAKAVHAVASKN